MQTQAPLAPTTPKNKKNGVSVIFEKPAFWLLALVILFGVPLFFSFRSPQPKLPPVLGMIPNFSLTNQDGRELTWASEFKGSVLIVNFIFTSCPDVCPLLSKQMAKIQDRLQTAAPIIRQVSISVDPAKDTPAVLKAYGEKYQARFKSWSFLTGDLNAIYDTVVNGFKVAMENQGLHKTATNDPKSVSVEDKTYDLMEITHGEHFVIVDQSGQIRAYMRGNNDQDLNEMVKLVSLVANTDPKNAQATGAR